MTIQDPHVEDTPADIHTKTAHVLVVDDSTLSRRKISLAIETLGHRCASAGDGQAAIDRLRCEHFDLVILDILMPVMDGFDTLKAIKSDPALSHIPVIVVSGLEDETDSVARAIKLGAEDFLPKEFDRTILKARVGASLERKWLRDQELAYRRDIDQLIGAARVIEAGNFRPSELRVNRVAARSDSLGSLAKVFESLAQEVYQRERAFDTATRKLRGTLLVLAAGSIFGVTPAIGRMAAEFALPPIGLVFWANVVAATVCLAFSFWRNGLPRFNRADLAFLFAWAIVLGSLYQGLTIIIAAEVEAANISLIGSARGFIVFLLAAALSIEAPSRRRFVGLGIGFVAVSTILIFERGGAHITDIWWLGAAFLLPLMLAIHTLLMARKPASLDATLAVGGMMFLSAVMLLPLVASTGSFFTPWSEYWSSLGLVLALGTSSALALVLALDLVKLAGPVFASQMAYAQALAGIVWAMLLLGETLSIAAWGAFLVVIAGVWLVSPRSTGDDFRISLRPDFLKPRRPSD